MQITTIHNQQQQLQNDIEQLQTRSNKSSLGRGIFILTCIITLFQGYYTSSYWYLASIVFLLLFLLLVKRHNRIHQALEDTQVMLGVWKDMEDRKQDGWKHFADNGSAYLKEEATQAYDLDLFGANSLYQFLCVAKSVYGKQRLAELLSWDMQMDEEQANRAKAVAECRENITFTTEMVKLLKLYELHGKRKKKVSMEALFTYMETQEKASSKWLRYGCFGLSCATLMALIASMLSVSYAYVLALATLSLCLSLLTFLKHSRILTRVDALARLIGDYERMFTCLSASAFHSVQLCAIKQESSEAKKALRELKRIVCMVQLRSNSILFFIVNAFALLDFQCVFALEAWKQRYGSALRTWIMAIAEVEALLSLAQLGLAKEHFCQGERVQQAPYLRAEKITHPLLREEQAIANSITLRHGTYIITGSNMSGKTTFLRTLGINMVLFYAGAGVCATHFEASTMALYTSMRVHDNVSEGISTFYAEILRIQKMNEASRQKKPMLVLIDEIFKGTNSADRIYCARQAIRCLHQPWIITMVSTHDFELCELEHEKDIQAHNYHFAETYENERILFDYRLQEGTCTTTNARALMRLAGFKEEL